MINARAEPVAEKPSFRSAFEQRRCLVIADGYYEWQKVPEQKTKQPYYLRMADSRPFAFAGLWERWKKGEAPIESCTIITTAANQRLSAIHHRMPVILPPSDFETWLSAESDEPAALHALLRPYADHDLAVTPVSRYVNNARNDDPGCLAPAESQQQFSF